MNKQKIYSVQTESNQSTLIEIETIIMNGLYRFSILGINQKNSTDTKDRIYSALRSQKLVNLKSDNKKITVNLLPTNIDKRSNVYDLAIALSCLSCMNQIDINEDIIVIGELSILGNIISSNLILRTIHQAIQNNIKTIVCGQNDINTITKYKNNIVNLIEDSNIKFISSENLGDLIQDIKIKKYYVFDKVQYDTFTDIDLNKNNSLKTFSLDILKIILALCTRRNVFIENKKNSYIEKYIRNLMYYNNKLRDHEILQISNILNINDNQILEKYIYPKVSILDSQTQKNDLFTMLNESVFGFNVIEDFLNMNDESWYIIKKNHKSSILCFYNACPCGNNNIFFNSIDNNRCFCVQRNILKYRQRVQKIENGFFDFHIHNISEAEVEVFSDDYLKINNIISKFRNTTLEISESGVSDNFIHENINLIERNDLDHIINLAKDIAKLNHITNKGELTLNKENICLAIELLKKGF